MANISNILQTSCKYEFCPKERAIGISDVFLFECLSLPGLNDWSPRSPPVSLSIGSLKVIVTSDIHRSDQQRLKETLYTGNFALSVLVHLLFCFQGFPRCSTALLQRDTLTIVQALLWILLDVRCAIATKLGT
eukprot:s1483_g6.t1